MSPFAATMRKLESILAERAHLDADDRDLRSRTDAKEERVAVEEALSTLADELVKTKASWLAQLDLGERLQDAIHDAQKIKSPIAKNRQLRIVRRELRDANWEKIQKLLGILKAHGNLPSSADASTGTGNAAGAWVGRLVTGASAFDEFVAEFPDADRTQLRQLIRNLEKAPASKASKAKDKLLRAVGDLINGK